MNIVTALSYWLIVAIWAATIGAIGYFYLTNRRVMGTTGLLLAVLVMDGFRNICENVYFGLYFGSKFGLFGAGIARVLGNPYLLILPKLTNVVAGCGVLLKWLPEEVEARRQNAAEVKHLQIQATTDGMTGLLNRREFTVQAKAEWERYNRYGRPLSMAIIDIDHFKSINDQFGHIAGDEIIIAVAKACLSTKRLNDIAGRLGGEEFAIVLPETRMEDARIFAERLRERVAQETAKALDGKAPRTVSIGLSCTPSANSVVDSLRQADLALYEAKRSGRNRVCSYDAETTETVPSRA